jgi:hypothetical protein
MVLFEIWSVGKKPFSQFTNNEAFKLFESKYNQPLSPLPLDAQELFINSWWTAGKQLSTKVDRMDILISRKQTALFILSV